jgi:two-component system, OmpR family, phosphate regulon sensor histidine kinase PhoR
MSKPFAQVRKRLELASGLAFLFALLVAAVASNGRPAASSASSMSPLASPMAICRRASSKTSQDEIGRVAAAIDKTARRVEQSFAAVVSSQRQLETLLNSMQDAVIAVSDDGLVQWANRP